MSYFKILIKEDSTLKEMFATFFLDNADAWSMVEHVNCWEERQQRRLTSIVRTTE